jgi:hypothetical protein
MKLIIVPDLNIKRMNNVKNVGKFVWVHKLVKCLILLIILLMYLSGKKKIGKCYLERIARDYNRYCMKQQEVYNYVLIIILCATIK